MTLPARLALCLGLALALFPAPARPALGAGKASRELQVRVAPGVFHLGNRIRLDASMPLATPAYFLEGDLVAGADWGRDARLAAVKQVPPTAFPGTLEIEIEVQCFNTGSVQLPPLPVTLRAGGGTESYILKVPPISVSALLPPGDQPKPPLAAPVPVPRPFPWGWLVGGVALACAAAFGAFLWWKKRRARPALPELKPSLRDTDPDRWIAEEVERLFGAPLECQIRYAALSQRVRDYLEIKSGLPFLEWTTGEVRTGLHRLGNLPEGAVTDVMALLSLCDWAVFARYKPDPDEEREARRRILQFIALARVGASPQEGAA